jgi:hypothetical protein
MMPTTKTPLTQRPAWKALQTHYGEIPHAATPACAAG